MKKPPQVRATSLLITALLGACSPGNSTSDARAMETSAGETATEAATTEDVVADTTTADAPPANEPTTEASTPQDSASDGANTMDTNIDTAPTPEPTMEAGAPEASPTEASVDVVVSDVLPDVVSTETSPDVVMPDVMPACGAGESRCPGLMGSMAVCSNLASDSQNCGMCGNACPSGRACAGGTCTCPTGTMLCGTGTAGLCSNLQTDNANCGTCGSACPSGTTCTMGTCVCAMGQALCGSGSSARCTTLQTDSANCGMCGNACPSGQSCSDGRCVCPSGQTACGMGSSSVCVNTQTDNANCGMCGNACPTGQVCTMGMCRANCTAPLMACGTGSAMTCADLTTDQNNCGTCGTRCTLTANASLTFCLGGSCLLSCSSGFGNCNNVTADGCEVRTNSDTSNCGRCGNVCGMNDVCRAGNCVPRTCAELHASQPSLPSGAYTLDVDGDGPLPEFSAYCDMTYQGGGWTLYMALSRQMGAPRTPGPSEVTAGTVQPGGAAFMPSATLQALANLSSQVHIRSRGMPTRSITSVANALPIRNLRALRILNQDSVITSPGVSAAQVNSEWTGQFAMNADYLWFTCGPSGRTYPDTWWACNNGATGTHIVGPFSRWSWSGGSSTADEDMELYTR